MSIISPFVKNTRHVSLPRFTATVSSSEMEIPKKLDIDNPQVGIIINIYMY